MDEFKRPASRRDVPRFSQRRRVASEAVEGFVTPALTKTDNANQTTQPYRRAQVAAAESRTARANHVRRRTRPSTTRLARFDMDLPEGVSSKRHYMKPRIRRRARQVKAWIIRGSFATTAAIVVVGCLLISQGFFNLNKVFTGSAETAAALQEGVNPNLLKGEGDGRINVLLTGVGGPGHAGGDLTDTLILASIDPVNDSAVLLSVPRDLWVTIPGKGSMKINAAYAIAKHNYMSRNDVDSHDAQAIAAGLASIDQTMERVLGVPIHYNLLVNFQAFRQAVDTVGGITVSVPEDLYDPTMAWENGYDPYLARKGEQLFDGKQALMYARSRETSSDFARGERQRGVMLALKQKVVTAGVLSNPKKISDLVGAFGTNVQTDLSLSDASRMYSIIKGVSNANFRSVSLAGTTGTTSGAAGTDSLVTTGNINGQSIVMPKAGLENYEAIQEFVRGQLQDGYIVKEKAKVLVLNGTVESGLGQRMADKLKSYGYNVVGVRNAPSNMYMSTEIIKTSKAKQPYTKNYLEQRFNTTTISKLPDPTIKPGNADFVVILGTDEAGIN